MDDPWNLARFVEAQEGVYKSVLEELRRGLKRNHWMWYIFPQLAGLGSSATSRTYSIAGLDEARAYIHHALLGPRLVECTQLVLELKGRPAKAVFGSPDDMKFRSCMTLFALADPDTACFQDAVNRYYSGQVDDRTIAILSSTEG